MKKKLICIEGKTGVGKDTFANFIHEKTNIPIVCSYTTRDIREGEVNGIQHYYITPEEMQRLLKAEDVIAYAKKESGVEYAATYHSLADESIYIVDPTGIYYLREHYADKIDLYVVQLLCPEEIVEERIKARGDNWEKFLEKMNVRSSIPLISGISQLQQLLTAKLCISCLRLVMIQKLNKAY